MNTETDSATVISSVMSTATTVPAGTTRLSMESRPTSAVMSTSSTAKSRYGLNSITRRRSP